MHPTQASAAEHSPAGSTEAPLQVALRQALRQAGGRVVLSVTPAAPHQRRVVRALLQEGAQAAGGQVVDGPHGDIVLIGAEATRATRLRQLLDRLLGGSGSTLWSLEADLPALRRYAQADPNEAGPDLASLDAWLEAAPLPPLVRRRQGQRRDGPAFLRLEIAREALQTRLGGLGADSDLLRHAAQALAGRLLHAIADPAQARLLIGGSQAGGGQAGGGLPGGATIHLPVPPAIMAPGGERPNQGPRRLMATLAIEEMADPPALSLRRAALAARGWGVELDGLEPALLPMLNTEALPADLLRLHWSAALTTPASMLALRRIAPAALLLSGVDTPQARDWAQGLGITALEGNLAGSPAAGGASAGWA